VSAGFDNWDLTLALSTKESLHLHHLSISVSVFYSSTITPLINPSPQTISQLQKLESHSLVNDDKIIKILCQFSNSAATH
jgi:hypothetical protein